MWAGLLYSSVQTQPSPLSTAWVSLHNTRKNRNCNGPGLSSEWPLSSWEFWFHSHSSFPVLGPFPSALRINGEYLCYLLRGLSPAKGGYYSTMRNLLYAQLCPQIGYFFFLTPPLTDTTWEVFPSVKDVPPGALFLLLNRLLLQSSEKHRCFQCNPMCHEQSLMNTVWRKKKLISMLEASWCSESRNPLLA